MRLTRAVAAAAETAWAVDAGDVTVFAEAAAEDAADAAADADVDVDVDGDGDAPVVAMEVVR